ncbi:MAG: TDP-N-acetylfucosamine:lipid II N-acetylfucosaminyltransferase [Crocinitomicaceae bacterium]|nr:TDP-N-acetylfucosamine:lipid II N-acetylfucosaminyltransferase [Crocinitomicaceae bacterium]
MISDKKILHIFDPAIISQSTIELFEKLNFNQRYLIIALHPEKWETFEEISNVRIIDYHKENVISILVDEINDADIIFAQALSYEKAKAIVRTKSKTKVFIWALWGYELYNIADYFKNNTSKDTSTTLRTNDGLLSKIKNYYVFNSVYKRAVQKLDICLFLLESDYKLLGEVIEHNATWRTTGYQTLESLIGQNGFDIHGDSVLLGNSSTPSNRHDLAFDYLSKVETLNRAIVSPLNYGDAAYRSATIKTGKDLFGEKFVPLVDFMPLNEYIEILKTCSHVILPHQRQQGFGTIMTMLYGGAKLYLSEESPFYNWLKDLGIIVFSIEDDLSNELTSNLSLESQKENRKIVSQYLAEDLITKQITDILVEACQISKMKLSEKA